MKILINADGYEVKDIFTADVILQPNFFKSRFEELKGRMTGETKDFYNEFFEQSIKEAKNKLFEKLENGEMDAVTDIRITPFMSDLRGDVMIGAAAQGLGLKKVEK